MIAIGLKLTDAGVADYWDEIDRWYEIISPSSSSLLPSSTMFAACRPITPEANRME